jgi:hypothetical protein
LRFQSRDFCRGISTPQLTRFTRRRSRSLRIPKPPLDDRYRAPAEANLYEVKRHVQQAARSEGVEEEKMPAYLRVRL